MSTLLLVSRIAATAATSLYMLTFAMLILGCKSAVLLPKTEADKAMSCMLVFCIFLMALRGVWL